MQSTWLDKLERKFRKFSIPNLMNLILVGMAVVFLSDIFLSVQYGTTLSSYLYFSRSAIFHGEVWRILSFLFIPINSSPIWILFSMYFYWLIGSGLEREWGSFRFNVFYLCGAIGTILSGLITGYVGNTYLNFSLFLAFALLYPDFQVMLFFILPVKMKWLAWLDVAEQLVGKAGNSLCFCQYSIVLRKRFLAVFPESDSAVSVSKKDEVSSAKRGESQ